MVCRVEPVQAGHFGTKFFGLNRQVAALEGVLVHICFTRKFEVGLFGEVASLHRWPLKQVLLLLSDSCVESLFLCNSC